jgi:hypothetical protein
MAAQFGCETIGQLSQQMASPPKSTFGTKFEMTILWIDVESFMHEIRSKKNWKLNFHPGLCSVNMGK